MATIEERLKDTPRRLIVLAACGVARTVEHLLTDQRSRDAIEVAEHFVDGLATIEEVRRAGEAAEIAFFEAWGVTNADLRRRAEGFATGASGRVPSEAKEASMATRGAALAAVATARHAASPATATNAFFVARDGAIDATKATAKATDATEGASSVIEAVRAADEVHQSILTCILSPRIQFPFPVHIKALARGIYERRDWSLMPILADTLQEIGQADMAQHCRQLAHAKGCHVLDAILGK